MNRRDMIKLMAGTGLAAITPWGFQRAYAFDQSSPLILSLMVKGGMDQSSWCDPRNDTKVNNWARNANAGQAGNIRYAPMANNASFFDKHFDKTLVINGIDLNNSMHGTARIIQSGGSQSKNDPCMAALYAKTVARDLPMPWLIRLSKFDEQGGSGFSGVKIDGANLSQYSASTGGSIPSAMIRQSDVDLINAARLARLERMLRQTNRMPREEEHLEQLRTTHINSTKEIVTSTNIDFNNLEFENASGNEGKVKFACEKVLAAMAVGVCAAGCVEDGRGWDTHDNHDSRMPELLTGLVDILDSIWKKAEDYGVDNRLLVHVTSDVGRRPYYNSKKGKDHWAVTSTILMRKGQNWTNRVIGMSSNSHDKTKISPQDGSQANNGVQLTVTHVNRTIKQILGIPNAGGYDDGSPQIDLLNPALSSPVPTT